MDAGLPVSCPLMCVPLTAPRAPEELDGALPMAVGGVLEWRVEGQQGR